MASKEAVIFAKEVVVLFRLAATSLLLLGLIMLFCWGVYYAPYRYDGLLKELDEIDELSDDGIVNVHNIYWIKCINLSIPIDNRVWNNPCDVAVMIEYGIECPSVREAYSGYDPAAFWIEVVDYMKIGRVSEVSKDARIQYKANIKYALKELRRIAMYKVVEAAVSFFLFIPLFVLGVYYLRRFVLWVVATSKMEAN